MQKSTKLWIRVLSLALVVLMLGSMLLACKKKEEGATDTTNGDVVNPNNSNNEKKNVLDGVRYNGENIYVHAYMPSNVVEVVEEFSSELGIVEQNVYKRLDETEKQLNINVEWKEANSTSASFVQDAVLVNQTGGCDVVTCYSVNAAPLTTQGVAKNLLAFNTMDFTHPAWPADMVDQMKLYNKLYFCTGDISTNLIFMTALVYVNLDLVSTWRINEKIQTLYGEDNLYDLVREGKWTYDAMFRLTEGIWQDTDGSKARSDLDTYGFATYSSLLCNFYAGAGYTLLESDENGMYLSEDYTNVDGIEKLLKLVNENLHDEGWSRYFGSEYEVVRDNFSAGLHLFSLAPASHAYVKHYHTDNLNYSALPVPKYTTEQEEYHSWHCEPYSNYILASGSAHPEITASFLQCLAQWSYDTTRIAIFENTMKARFSQGDSDITDMWEMIVDSQTFDLGRIFEKSLRRGGAVNGIHLMDLVTDRLEKKRSDWQNLMDSYEQEIQDLLTALNGTLQTLPQE